MAFCGKCGAQYEEGTKFCPACGAPVAEEQVNAPVQEQTYVYTQAPVQEQAQEEAQGQYDFSAKIQEFNNTADTTGDFDSADIEQNKIMGILAYISWLVLVPIFAAPNSKFARFHANQGLVLAIVEIVYGIATGVLSSILYAISFTLGSIISTLFSIVAIVFFVVSIIGIINAVNGKAKELPLIGKIRILK